MTTPVGEAHKYDDSKTPLGLLSRTALIRIGEILAYGARKYDAHNWRKGLEWSRVIDAALRHLLAFNEGEDTDPESGLSHAAHAACNLMFLLEYIETHPELDDRYGKKEKYDSITSDTSSRDLNTQPYVDPAEYLVSKRGGEAVLAPIRAVWGR
ncbi:MAG TPA: dATP/dGTP diphosphohydrolase domain-containing protein [Candidatus Tripitaka californicus]|uniref:dATP/dGTP diphosphohydrolase domain-containing protein n=1 Tax=Candidatus Tripitaka californicus TaxID=3367616 RepID=UPI0040268054